MKKRAMKKWIPRNTIYCRNCRWRHCLGDRILHRNTDCEQAGVCKEECWSKPYNSCQVSTYRCEYLGYTDNKEESLLWEGCKECGEHYPKLK